MLHLSLIRRGPLPYNLLLIAGPSGVGKGTIIRKLQHDYPSYFGFCLSHTTRSPRPQEKDGVHYHFTDLSTMETMVQAGDFLETAYVHGQRYGTSWRSIEAVVKEGKRACILDIDVQGVVSVKKAVMAGGRHTFLARSVFFKPPDMESLRHRLSHRGTEAPEVVARRLQTAEAEMDFLEKNPEMFDFVCVQDHKENPGRYREILKGLLLA